MLNVITFQCRNFIMTKKESLATVIIRKMIPLWVGPKEIKLSGFNPLRILWEDTEL